jgi:hypothetical protein
MDLAVSTTPWKRSFLAAERGSSISASEAGRLMRVSRSCALLFRCEIMDSTAQIAATMPANTSSGMMSARPTKNAKATVHLSISDK